MERTELSEGILVKNLKHGNIEKVLHLGLMKMESGEWKDAVIYMGKDRFSPYEKIFCKKTDDFLKEFEVYIPDKDLSFSEYMDRVKEQLECNVTEEFKSKYPYNVFSYTEEEIMDNKLFFIHCHQKGLSAYKALTLFGM